MRRRPLNRTGRFDGLLPNLLLVMLILSAGCSDPGTAPDATTGKAKSAPQPLSSKTTGTGDIATEAAPPPVYAYIPGDRRDPFMSIVARDDSKSINKLSDRPPLERYTIAEFTLTGIIWGGFGYNAMLEGPNGKGYFVRVGTVIGPDRSVIKKITQDSMVIEERFKNYMGVEERREIIVNLRKRQEGTQ